MLRFSTLYKLDYWLGLVHPTLMLESVKRMDCLLKRILGTTIGMVLTLYEGLKLDPGIKGLRGLFIL